MGIGANVNVDKLIAQWAFGIDSMASLHVSGNKHLFRTLKRCAPVTVTVADGSVLFAEYLGDIVLRLHTAEGRVVAKKIESVYFHERFKANLLCWDVLRMLGWEFHSTDRSTYLYTPDREDKIPVLTNGRVSVLPCAPPERIYAVGVRGANVGAIMRAHEKLGHMGFDQLVRVLKGNHVLDVTRSDATVAEINEARTQIINCAACAAGKGTRTSFGHRGMDFGRTNGEVLHMDTYQVPVKRDGRDVLEYGLTVTDSFSGWRWFAHLPTKDIAASRVIAVIRNANNKLGCKVKRIYADGGTEFINHTLKHYCEIEGIEWHYPPARTQQLNGVAENAVRSTKDASRTLMLASKLPAKWWFYAAAHATYLWNRTHVAKRTGRTPYELIFNKKPSAKHWGNFGCDALYHIVKGQRGPLDAKREPCIYLGHDHTQNCATVFAIRAEKIIHTRDVSYRPTSFSYSLTLHKGKDAMLELLSHGTANELFTSEVDHIDDAEPMPSSREEEEAADVESGKEYPVERILGQREEPDGSRRFLVKWGGYAGANTWEPEEMMRTDAPHIVRDYEAAAKAPSPRLAPVVPEREAPREQRLSKRVRGIEPESVAMARHEASAMGVPSVDYSDEQPSEQMHYAMCAIANINPDIHSDMDAGPVTAVAHAVSAGTAVLESNTPQTWKAAMASDHADDWERAMQKEINSCEDKLVWTLVPRNELPRGANVLPAKWVFKTKTDSDGNVIEYKARVTPKGFLQKEGKDYFEVYARTGMYKSMRVGLSLAALWDHEIEQLDVPTAFLNADVDEVLHMEIPEGFRKGNEDMILLLHKALYGLKQAPRNWYMLVSKFILDLGFRACISDPCLFWLRSKTGRVMLLFLFVDDFQVSFHKLDREQWGGLKARLVARFNTKDMGESKWILGMRIARDRVARTITLDQELYVTKALEKYGFAECRSAETPEVVGAAHATPTEQEQQPCDKQRFMEITGTLMYAAISTRLDIAHAVRHLAGKMLNPTNKDMSAADRVMRYLHGARAIGLEFGSRNGVKAEGDSRGRTFQNVDCCAYADADWANNKDDRKSISGWVAKLNGDPISWASRKQRVVALSTCEAELYATADATKETMWLRDLLAEIGLHVIHGATMFGDNQSSLAVIKNGIKGDRTKHVDIKYHFLTQSNEEGKIILKWVPSAEQQADIFTKALGAPVFLQLRKQLMTA